MIIKIVAFTIGLACYDLLKILLRAFAKAFGEAYKKQTENKLP